MDEQTLRRHDLTPSQAKALADIAQRKADVEKEWHLALVLAGLEPETVVRGNLVDDPHFMVRAPDDDAVPA